MSKKQKKKQREKVLGMLEFIKLYLSLITSIIPIYIIINTIKLLFYLYKY